MTGNFFLNTHQKNLIENNQPVLKPNNGQIVKKVEKRKIPLMTGEWEVWSEKKGVSKITKDMNGNVEWNYFIPENINDSDAGVFISIPKLSMVNKTILVKLNSKRAFPLDVLLYSYVNGYSKKNDFDSQVVTSFRLNLVSGVNTFRLEAKDFSIPEWWEEENDNPSIEFNFDDIRGIEFNIELESDFGAPSDSIRFYNIDMVM